MADPQSVAQMDPVFEERLREFMTFAEKEYIARQQGNQVKWCRPLEWPGDPFDVEAMSPPFNRDASNADCIDAISNADSPGVTGDVVVSTTMIDYLSNIERAFRARFMRRPRAVSHMLGRKKGQGDQQGVFIQNGVEYVRSMLKQAKAKP